MKESGNGFYRISMLQAELLCAARSELRREWWKSDVHTPSFCRMYLVESGSLCAQVDRREYTVRRGQLLLMPEGHAQKYEMQEEATLVKYWCHFSASLLKQPFFELVDTPYCIAVDFDEARPYFAALIPPAAGIAGQVEKQASLLRLISYYLLCAGASLREKTEMGLDFTPVFDYIQTHIAQPVTVKALADTMYLNPHYFIRCFHQAYGCSPMQYVYGERLDRARELLASTRGTVGEIAAQLGFADPFYFSKFFKKHTGFSPTVYREMTANGIPADGPQSLGGRTDS